MSSLNAALLVIGLLILAGGPLLWWVFFRMDEHRPSRAGDALPTAPLPAAAISHIEASLGIKLPDAYRNFLITPREFDIDGESIFGDPEMIISSTAEYRNGFEGLPPWPENLVHIGDEADACPYALHVDSETVIRTDKGNLNRPPLERFESVADFLRKFDGAN